MLSLRLRRTLRRAILVLALTCASVIFPLSDLSAAPRSESRWSGPERSARVERQGFSFWHLLASLFERAGMRMDDNG
ncbi:MAG: hypothetical protein ACJ76J_25430 [Thermoanaerobaculia bacterium]